MGQQAGGSLFLVILGGIFVAAILAMIGCLVATVWWGTGLNNLWWKVFRWLKGSRVSYHFRWNAKEPGNQKVHATSGKFRTKNERTEVGVCGSVIEVSRGLFHRRSAIYGPVAKNWQIANVDKVSTGTGDWVHLKDELGLPLEEALQLINTYPSLQAVLDENTAQRNRIAELEQALSVSRELCEAIKQQRQVADNRVVELEQRNEQLTSEIRVANQRLIEDKASVYALLWIMDDDRQRYRSEPSKRVRKCLEEIVSWHSERDPLVPTRRLIDLWEARFIRRMDKTIS